MRDPAWLDVKGAAARVLVSSRTILRAARSGVLKGYKVGGHRRWRFKTADVDVWMQAQRPIEPSKPSGTIGDRRCSSCQSTDIRVWFRHKDTFAFTCLSCHGMFIVCYA